MPDNSARFLPVQEARPGALFPYRGTETHGVENVNEWADVPQGGANEVIVEYQDPEPEPTPIPVRIVAEHSAEMREWRVIRDRAGTNNARQLVGQMLGRTSVTIKNLSDAVAPVDRVWVGPDSTTKQYTGYPLDPGKELNLSTESEIYTIANDGNTEVPLAAYIEFTVEL